MSTNNNHTNYEVDREEFHRRIYDVYQRKHSNTFLLTPERYAQMIEQMKYINTSGKKCPADYRRAKRFDVIETPRGERLFTTLKPGQKERLEFVTTNEMYDIIKEYHLKLNHGGRSRMMVALKKKYKNITTENVLVYLSMCIACKNKLVKRGKGSDNTFDNEAVTSSDNDQHNSESQDNIEIQNVSINDIIYSHPELYSRGQVDILDVTTDSSEEYKYMMVYREYISKFIHLKPLKRICMEEMVDMLLEIFLVFGAPNILQSKNGMSVVKPICRRISTLCPDMKIVAGKGVMPSEFFKGKSNEDILKKLNDWLSESQSSKWQQGLKFVQHTLNTTFNEIICKTPSEAIFGVNPRKGLASFTSKLLYDDLVTENDLKEVLDEKEDIEQPTPKRLKLEESLVLPKNFIKLEADLEKDIEDTETFGE
ncbi:KRAB-A domain-containing protein 2 isoform X1 [Galleria mellonella]|uniref:KRAB-A domain-containing protein 2 isoform X1 n=1 Tax=Galleria mellonella TaxID=7137 RepID=A0ABM3MND8_GALME|nr:KRAB-A domain-containing protein 2 isoform X1 [Galleria mellonella]